MIDYDSFRAATLRTFFFAFHVGAKELISSMSDKLAAIIQLHHAGKTNSDIVKLLKAPRSTAYHTVSRFKELQSTKDRSLSGRPQSSRMPAQSQKIHEGNGP